MKILRTIAILGLLALLVSCGGGFNPFDIDWGNGDESVVDETQEDSAPADTSEPDDPPTAPDPEPEPEPEPEPVEVQEIPADANGSLEDLGWTGTEYEVVNGAITYSGSYDGWAPIETPAFDLSPTAAQKVVVNLDIFFDMTTSELQTIKGDRLAFYMDLDGTELHFKPRTANDPGNKYVGAGDFTTASASDGTVENDEYFKWNDYYTQGETWYNLQFEIYESGEIRALYNGVDTGVATTVSDANFTSFLVNFRGLSKSGIEYGLTIDNLSVTLEAIE